MSKPNTPGSNASPQTPPTQAKQKTTARASGKGMRAKKAVASAQKKATSTQDNLPDGDTIRPPKPEPSFEQDFSMADQALTQWMIKHPQEVIKHRQKFMQQLLKKRCSYGREGGILPVTLAPMFLKHSSVERIARVAEDLDKILDKSIQLYFKDEYVRSYFPYLDIPLEWVHWDPGYKKPTMLSRHDALFDGENLKFIEFNTDNPGGRGWLDTFENLLQHSPVYKDLLEEYCILPERPMLHALKEALLKCYREWGGTKKSPRVALVSFKEFLAGSDQEIIRDYLIEHGIEANFIDPREFEYRNGKLYSGNVQFDIVNISLRFTFFKKFPREMKDFHDALRDGAVCCVNHFRATLGSQKEMLSFISNEENHHYFTSEEAECIRKHIPWTRKMDETITISKAGTDISLLDYVLSHQEELVLKPTDAAGGYNVFVGKYTSKDQWQSAVDMAIGCPWWIIQEAVAIPEYEFPVIKDKQVVLEKKNLNLNPYIFDGKYVGCLGRISDSKVINIAAGGGIIPVFSLKPGVKK